MGAPCIDDVRKIVVHLLKGRRVVGFNLNQKLKLFGILEEVIADKLDTVDGCPMYFDCTY